MKTGTVDLSLHHGHVPAWLAGRMARLGRVVVEALVLESAIVYDQRRRALAWNGRTCFDSVAPRPRRLRLPLSEYATCQR